MARKILLLTVWWRLWSVSQVAKTPPFHGGNTSSNLVPIILSETTEPPYILYEESTPQALLNSSDDLLAEMD